MALAILQAAHKLYKANKLVKKIKSGSKAAKASREASREAAKQARIKDFNPSPISKPASSAQATRPNSLIKKPSKPMATRVAPATRVAKAKKNKK